MRSNRPRDVLLWLPRVLVPTVGLMSLAFVVPALNSLAPQTVSLAGWLALAMYWISASGGKDGLPFVLLFLTLVVAARTVATWKGRGTEAALILLVVGSVLGCGAWLNEHLIKPAFSVPRPNLAEFALTEPGMGMSIEEFYALPDKEVRSAYLEKVLPESEEMNARIREHWIAESGYSFPSGHTFAAMTFATFFLALARSRFIGTGLWLFWLLALWAVAVGFSRTILRVHSPTDILVGALEGMAVGTLAYLLLERIRQTLLPGEPPTEAEPEGG